MNATVFPSEISGRITAPPSKSFAHRLIIAACLSCLSSGGERTVKNVGDSADVSATAAAVRALGADCELVSGEFRVFGFKPVAEAVVCCGESGSTLRFLTPVAAALGVNATFTGSERLMQRPIEPLIGAIKAHGVTVSRPNVEKTALSATKALKISGRLGGGKFTTDGTVSSQFVTGLLLALPLTGEACEIEITGENVGKPYIGITLSVLKDCGVSVKRTGKGFFIAKGQKYSLPRETLCEGDWSGAAFPLAAGALKGSVLIDGLNLNSLQGDRKIIDVLRAFGADVCVKDGAVCVSRPENGVLDAVEVDCADYPDLAQVISVVAAFANGKTALKGTQNLVYKESDRSAAIINVLSSAKINARTDGKTIVVTGGKPCGFTADGCGDHRTVMAAAVLACGACGAGEILGADTVKKSYPDFFGHLIKLGGKVNVDI